MYIFHEDGRSFEAVFNKINHRVGDIFHAANDIRRDYFTDGDQPGKILIEG